MRTESDKEPKRDRVKSRDSELKSLSNPQLVLCEKVHGSLCKQKLGMPLAHWESNAILCRLHLKTPQNTEYSSISMSLYHETLPVFS